MKRSPLKRNPTPKKRTPISPASPEQRAKVKAEGVCRVCAAPAPFRLDPAHVADRSLGGCDHRLCVVPLCRKCHRAYDAHRLDLLPHLTKAEQAHAASHLGLYRALERTTNVKWSEAMSDRRAA